MSDAGAGRSTGVLGGAFNPPHIGHLVLAREAAEQLGLDRVLVVPMGRAPHRRIEPEPGPHVRFELTGAATADDELLEASALEVQREGPSYTFRTLELLLEQQPATELTLLMGADAAASLASWREPERIAGLARIAIGGRPGTALDRAEEAIAGLRVEPARVTMPELAISSSEIRRRVRAGRSLRYLVPDAVASLIAERGLYA